MAPSCPEEVDVFTVPHSRMKDLVCKYLDMLTATNFSNVVHLTTLLETLIKTFQEFIAHEQIENQFIMKKLKSKLRSLSIQNTAVCNCHKDDSLTAMLKFLQDGYKCTKKSEADRNNYGLQLRQALENFTETFLPHMEEEEEVFQPLLMQHFTFEELKQIKATVLQQHFKVESDDIPEKFVADNVSKKSESKVVNSELTSFDSVSIDILPDEVMLKVFSHLNPQELCRSAQVSKRWNSLAMDGSLWTKLYPVSWAKGDWDATCGVNEEDTISVKERLNAKSYDEDADVDETDDWDSEAREIQYQSQMLTSMCKHLLPRVGRTIKHCDLAYSKGLTNGSLYKILSLCPNLEYLDLTQTRVSDLGFKGFKKEGSGRKLRYLDLSGCLYITDNTLQHLSSALGQIPCHMTENVDHVTDHVTGNQDMTASEDEGCADCQKNRKNESLRCTEQDKQKKSHEKPVEKHLKIGDSSSLNPESCGSDKKTCCRTGTKECSTGPDKPLLARVHKVSTGLSSTYCSTKTDNGVYCCRNTPQEKHGCGTDCSEYPYVEIPDENGSDKIHDKKSDNESTELQDRSWIKGEGHCFERSQTIDIDLSPQQQQDLSTGSSGGEEQNTERRQDQKNLLNLNRSNHGDTDGVQDISIIQSELNPEQTDLLQQLFLHTWNEERDVNTEVTTKTFPPTGTGQKNDFVGKPEGTEGVTGRALEFLSLSGCYLITDTGLNYLTSNGGLPRLKYLDLSGCLNVAGEAVCELVNTTQYLDPAQLFYCDNILDGPFADTASGCQNLQCNSRVCCRCGE